ncbi:MAG: hypothetical protein J6A53_01695 [Clostridia bacterium]|nr:hypothetical protein [Clostridia bacterium]
MFKKYKNKILICSLVIIGVLLLLISSFDFSKKDEKDTSSYLYTEALEKKIEEFLKKVDGIYEAKVIVTLDTTEEKVYAQNSSGLDYILTNEGAPISITEIYPTVRGVAIACTNGDEDETKMKITELISAYLGISSNRIKIVSIG